MIRVTDAVFRAYFNWFVTVVPTERDMMVCIAGVCFYSFPGRIGVPAQAEHWQKGNLEAFSLFADESSRLIHGVV